MGSIGGNSNTRNTSEAPKYDNAYWSHDEGDYNPETNKSTTELIDRYVNDSNWKDNMRKDLNLEDATDAQIWALRNIFQGIQEYDKGYDANRTPFSIVNFTVEMLGDKPSAEREAELRRFGLRNTKRPISVMITTAPDASVSNAYIRMQDEKQRYVLIGPRGGYFKFDSKSNKQTVRPFDVRYGERTWKS